MPTSTMTHAAPKRALTAALPALMMLAGCNAPAPSSSRPSTEPSPRSSSANNRDTRTNAPLPGGGGARPRRGRPSAASQPGAFDFYLLNLSWSPQFCTTHPGSAECASHPGFLVHGLWPQNNDSTYPQNCGLAPGPTNTAALNGVMPPGLIGHEWDKHGTCSGLAPDAYVNDIVSAFHEVRIPASLAGASPPATLAPSAILQQFAAANPSFPAGSFALSCGANKLTAMEVCLAKDLRPEACEGVRTCGATVIGITPP